MGFDDLNFLCFFFILNFRAGFDCGDTRTFLQFGPSDMCMWIYLCVLKSSGRVGKFTCIMK